MMVILNEKKYVEMYLNGIVNENIIYKKFFIKHPVFVLHLIANYEFEYNGYKPKKAKEELIAFMKSNYPKFDLKRWDESIDKVLQQARHRTLLKIDYIYITPKELEQIESLNNLPYEKLAFSFLCMAKYRNAKNETNNNWVSNSIDEMFRLSRIGWAAVSKEQRMHTLIEKGYFRFATKVDNLNIQVLYVDETPESEYIAANNTNGIRITESDFSELGYRYLQYKGQSFVTCEYCHKLVRQSKNNRRKYCPTCSKLINIQKTMMNYKNNKAEN